VPDSAGSKLRPLACPPDELTLTRSVAGIDAARDVAASTVASPSSKPTHRIGISSAMIVRPTPRTTVKINTTGALR
jgi:hypothetical protein